MKPLLLTSILVATSATVSAQDNPVRVVQSNQVVPSTSRELTSLVIGLVESSSVNSTGYVNPQDSWAETSKAQTRIEAHFGAAIEIQIEKADQSGKAPELVEDVLFALQTTPFPDHILLKTRRGYESLTKYSPCASARFALAAGLTFTSFDVNSFLEHNCNFRD